MSKYVKGLVSNHVRERLRGVESAFLVNVSGLSVNQAVALRRELRQKKITLLVVKNSLALRATEGTPLHVAFDGRTGPSALMWGGDDFVSLAKEIIRIAKDKNFAPFAPTGGVLEGAWIGAEEVEKISKWPTRAEMLSRLVGQILGPGATLAAQILGPGGTLAGQIKQKSEGKEGEEQPATEKPAQGGEAAPAPA
jgi:large subunit ribosomal protein L10